MAPRSKQLSCLVVLASAMAALGAGTRAPMTPATSAKPVNPVSPVSPVNPVNIVTNLKAPSPPPTVSCPADVKSPVGAAAVVRPIAAQVRRLDKADITFTTGATRDGAIQVSAQSGDLSFRKTVRSNGSYTLDLETPHDTISISFAEHTITVTRGKKSVTLTPGNAADEDLDKVHTMLADSRAARMVRAAAAAIQDSEDDSPEGAAVMMSDAVVGMLTGDAAAPVRVARHLTRHLRATVRPIMMQVDCYTEWEQRVLIASYEMEACEADFNVFNPTRYLCAARWLLQSESYWFSFLACSGVPRV